MSKVGYKSPPKHSQFKKGQSGNPRGRPKNSKKEGVYSILKRKITIIENGKRREVEMIDAIMMKLANQALAGDKGAAKTILHLPGCREFLEMQQVATLPPVTFIVQGVMPEKVKKEGTSESEDSSKPKEESVEKEDSSES